MITNKPRKVTRGFYAASFSAPDVERPTEIAEDPRLRDLLRRLNELEAELMLRGGDENPPETLLQMFYFFWTITNIIGGGGQYIGRKGIDIPEGGIYVDADIVLSNPGLQFVGADPLTQQLDVKLKTDGGIVKSGGDGLFLDYGIFSVGGAVASAAGIYSCTEVIPNHDTWATDGDKFTSKPGGRSVNILNFSEADLTAPSLGLHTIWPDNAQLQGGALLLAFKMFDSTPVTPVARWIGVPSIDSNSISGVHQAFITSVAAGIVCDLDKKDSGVSITPDITICGNEGGGSNEASAGWPRFRVGDAVYVAKIFGTWKALPPIQPITPCE